MASPYPTKAMDLMWKYSIEAAHGASDERLAEIMRRIEEAQQEARERAVKKGKSDAGA